MRRTPLRRDTRLRARKVEHTPPTWEPVPMDLSAEAIARFRTVCSSTFTGPVGREVNRRPKTGDGSFSPVVRQTVIDRDGYRCQRCGLGVDSGAVGYSLQHRVARKMGGTNEPYIARPSNGLVLCGSGTTGCHGHLESFRELAEEAGMSVPSWADPLSVPYRRYDGVWLLLTDQGTAWPTKAPPNGALSVAHRLGTPRADIDAEDDE